MSRTQFFRKRPIILFVLFIAACAAALAEKASIDFSKQDSGFTEHKAFQVQGGKYWFHQGEEGYFHHSRYQKKIAVDFTVSVKACWTGGKNDSDFGLVFRFNGSGDYYIFSIDHSGNFVTYRKTFDGWQWYGLLQQKSSQVRSGENLLSVTCKGNQYQCSLNGVMVSEFRGEYPGNRMTYVGLGASGGVDCSFDDFTYQEISDYPPERFIEPKGQNIMTQVFDFTRGGTGFAEDEYWTRRDGWLQFSGVNDDYFRLTTYSIQNVFVDHILTVKAQWTGGTEDNGYGLIFRYVNNASFCLFNLSANGSYKLSRMTKDGWENISNWRSSDYIQKDSNVLTVSCIGREIKCYINGYLVIATEDVEFPYNTSYGFGAGSGVGCRFTDLQDILVGTVKEAEEAVAHAAAAAQSSAAAPSTAPAAAAPAKPPTPSPAAPSAAAPSKPAISPTILGGMFQTLALAGDGSLWLWGKDALAPVRLERFKGVSGITGGPLAFYVLIDGMLWSSLRLGFNPFDPRTLKKEPDPQEPLPVCLLDHIVTTARNTANLVILRDDGTVWERGLNTFGQIGDGTTISRVDPVQVKNMTDACAVAGGMDFSLAVKRDGTVWAWGSNREYQLGNGQRKDSGLPAAVSGLSGITAIASGYDYSLALAGDGTVWAWGNNDVGQLGDDTRTSRKVPVKVKGIDHVIAIDAGANICMALKKDGTVWTWGGSGKTGSKTPVQVQGLADVVAVETGDFRYFAVKKDGTVWAWGVNGGALGIGTTENTDTPTQVKGLTLQ